MLTLVSELFTVFLALMTILIACVRPSSWVRRRLLARPLRKVSRKRALTKLLMDTRDVLDQEHCETNEHVKWFLDHRKDFRQTVMDSLLEVLDGEDVLPADIFARVNASDWLTKSNASVNYQAYIFCVLLRRAATSRRQSLWSRVLYPEDARQMRDLMRSISAYLDDFANSFLASGAAARAGERSEIEEEPRGRPVFADFASAFSGAIVLADSVEWRSRFATKALVWHRRSFRHAKAKGGTSRETFDSAHPRGKACALPVNDRQVGDFDRRVLDLRSVAPIESPTKGWTGFLLDTGETCYLTSEQGSGAIRDSQSLTAPTDGEVLEIGCKHLLPTSSKSPSHRIKATDHGVELVQGALNPVSLITAYVSLLTSDGYLVLVKRSRQVRHGRDVFSATAGGVLEPDGEGSEGDIDSFGRPSLASCVQREAREEIGLELEASSLRPVCVFLSNIRSQPHSAENDPPDPRAGRGQMVAVVLFLAHTDKGLQQVRDGLSRADPALGKFEVDHLIEVEMKKGSEAVELARWAKENALKLDQHGLLSCLYAAAVLDAKGAEGAQRAFSKEFALRPWWHEGIDKPSDIRIVRDPRLVVEPAGKTLHGAVPWECVGPREWARSWTQLSVCLDAARAVMDNDVMRGESA